MSEKGLQGQRPRPARKSSAPYKSSLEHLLDELGRIDLLIRMQVARARKVSGDDALRGLSISEADVEALLGRPPGTPHWASAPADEGLDRAQAAVDQKAREIQRRIRKSAQRGIPLRLPMLAERFGLDRFDVDVVLIAIAPEIDLRYERLFAYLNDDVTRKRPTVDTALGLLCSSFEARMVARRRFTAGAPLIRHGLLSSSPDASDRQTSLLGSPVVLDERVVEHLLDGNEIDPRIARCAVLSRPAAGADDLLAAGREARALIRFIRSEQVSGRGGPIIHLQGPDDAGRCATAEAVCRELGVPLLVVDGHLLLAASDDAIRSTVPLLLREATLRGAAVHWSAVVDLLESGKPAARSAVMDALRSDTGLVFMSGSRAWEPPGSLLGRSFLSVDLPSPKAAEQARIWAAALGRDGAPPAEIDLDTLTSMFRLTGGQIRDAAEDAHTLARFRDPGAPAVTHADLTAACRRRSSQALSALARKITPHDVWDDLVLPRDRKERLREIVSHVMHRSQVLGTWGFDRKLSLGKGVSALFSGPPGTGKTMAAGVIAAELGLDLYHVDLSGVVSKYIGETEKHLERLFSEAEASNAVLFFDEADALFGKRTEVKDAHDRYANLETSFLLQRIDAYEGVVILSTNFTKNMDEAFVRRLSFVVEFTMPNEQERLAIWQRIFPPETPRRPDVDLAFLARRFEISGSHVRNIALGAAFLAAREGTAVGMSHLMTAARREYLKMGKVVDPRQFVLPDAAAQATPAPRLM